MGTDGQPGPYQWYTYETARSYAAKLATGIAALGLKKGDRVGVFGKNCPNWALIEIAAAAQGMVLIPFYDTLGAEAVQYIGQHAEVRTVFCSPENLPKLDSAFADVDKAHALDHVVVFGREGIALTKDENVKVSDFKDKLLTIEQVVAKGVDDESKLFGGEWEDLFVIMYTSGTTGKPKGVTLRNKALISSVASALRYFEHWNVKFERDCSMLSYLPLAHIFEQQGEALIFGAGGKVGYYTGDIKLLLNDLEALKPTTFIGVPRVFARFQQRIEETIEKSSFIARKLFSIAYNRQLRHVQDPINVGRSRLWDMLVFSKVRAKLLPNCRLVITGSAPMSAQTNDFLKICLMCPVVQGYGLTETVGGMVCSPPNASLSGHCGGPLPSCQVKLCDVPEMGYTSKDKPFPRGEICLKGTMVTGGYYKSEKETADAFDEDGFFKTGDIGQWLKSGSLQIIDRKKNLFKLSQGEYVSPETLEQEYQKVKLVSQIFVYGDSFQNFLVAVVVPDLAAAKAAGYTETASLATNDKFKKEVLAQLADMKKVSGFKGYEVIKDCYVETEGINELGQGFYVENDLLTPTFKLKRPQLRKRYKTKLDEMYAKS